MVTKRVLIDSSMYIFANIVLSLNGEDILVKAAKDSITVATPSVRSGLRALISIDRHHRLLEKISVLNTNLAVLGWTVYAKIGMLNLAVLGLKGRRGFLISLLFFGRIGRMFGAV